MSNLVLEIFVIYRSPSSSKQEFLDFFENWLDVTRFLNKGTIISGDLNIDLLKTTPDSKRLKNIINLNNMKIINNEATRVTNDSATMIDLIISNIDQIIAECNDNMKMSDHDTLTCNIQFHQRKQHQKYNKNINQRDKPMVIKEYHKIDFMKLNNVISSNLRIPSEPNRDLNQTTSEFIKQLERCVEQETPKKTVLNNDVSFNKPWLRTTEIIKLEGNKRQAWKKFKYNKNPIMKETLWSDFKTIRNQYTNLTRKKRRNYFEEKIDLTKNDPKKMWRVMKVFTTTKTQSDIALLKNIKFNDEYQELNLPDKFNSYYVNSIKELEASIPITKNYNLYSALQIMNIQSKFSNFNPQTLNDLSKVIHDLKNVSSCGVISVKVLKQTFQSVGDHLLGIINQSLIEGIFPEDWKKSTIIPIPKVDKPKLPQDTRPINMLPSYEKVLEIIAHHQISNYLEKNNLLYSKQFGFRKGKNTEQAIQVLLSSWRKSLNENKFVIALSIDLRRAFETIAIIILLEKLQLYGIQGTVLQWLKSYLTNRSQEVKLENDISTTLPCDIGVPQGSVLGPLLFNTYINDLHKFIEHSDVFHFADDTLFSIEGDDLPTMCEKLNEDIKSLLLYCEANKLKVHPEKFQCILITTSIQRKQQLLAAHTESTIKVSNTTLPFQDSMKYLGVKIDSTLNFDTHISYITPKISKKIGFLRRVGRDLSNWSRKLVYNTIIAPHFTYCSTILFDINHQHVSTLQKLQNRGMRAILQCHPRTPRKDMLKELGWLSIHQQNVLQTILFIRDAISQENNNFQCYLKKNCDVHQYNTRRSQNFHLTHQNNKSAQKSIFINGLKIYNNLPTELKDIATHVSRRVFKDRVSKFVSESIPILPNLNQ